MSEIIPAHGVRILLELERDAEVQVVYRVELHAPDASFTTRSAIDLDGGTVFFAEWEALRGEGAPEAWMVEGARAFLRTVHKNHASERNWPRRQLRWREKRG